MSPAIDVETGIIEGWTQGTKAEIHFKVCDQCTVSLIDEKDEIVKEHEGYVPDCLSPKENGYGDYIIMDIDENGKIKDWNPNFSDIIETNE